MLCWFFDWPEQAGRAARSRTDNKEKKTNLWDFETIGYPFKRTSFFIKGMFDLPGHETLRVGFERSQAGPGAKVDPLSPEEGAGIEVWVVNLPVTNGESFVLLTHIGAPH